MLKKFLNSVKEDKVPFIVIAHANCWDGTGAASAVIGYCLEHYIDEPTIIRQQYGQEVPNVENSNVLLLDFSFSKEVLLDLNSKNNDLFIVDHHESAKKDLSEIDFCHFDMNHSAAYLMWDLLLGYIPTAIKYIEDRDIWKWKLSNSRAFSAGLQLLDVNDVHGLYTRLMYDDMLVNMCIKSGDAILQYQEVQIDKVKSKLYNGDVKLVKFFGYTVPLFNNNNLLSEVGNMLCQEHPFSIQYFFTKDEIIFSFRANGLVNLTNLKIPRGHPNAAGRGFKLDSIDLNKMFKCEDLGKYLETII